MIGLKPQIVRSKCSKNKVEKVAWVMNQFFPTYHCILIKKLDCLYLYYAKKHLHQFALSHQWTQNKNIVKRLETMVVRQFLERLPPLTNLIFLRNMEKEQFYSFLWLVGLLGLFRCITCWLKTKKQIWITIFFVYCF